MSELSETVGPTASVGLGVLAGGEALRLGDDFQGKPKVFLPITTDGSGLLAHLAASAHRLGLRVWAVAEPWKMPIIRNNASLTRWPINWVEDPGRGTAVALEYLLKAVTVSRLIVMNCDTLVPFSLGEIVNLPKPIGPIRQHLTVHSVQNNKMLGVERSGKEAYVAHWGEGTKIYPSGSLEAVSSTGVYEFNVALMRQILGSAESFETDLMPLLVRRGDVEAVVHSSTFPTFDYGTSERYRTIRSNSTELVDYLRLMRLI